MFTSFISRLISVFFISYYYNISVTGSLKHFVLLGLFLLGINLLCLMSSTLLWMVELCGWSFQRMLISAVGFVLRMGGFQPSLKLSRSTADSLTQWVTFNITVKRKLSSRFVQNRLMTFGPGFTDLRPGLRLKGWFGQQ